MLPVTPTKLGRYEIVDEIGKGAMGVVYLARDPLIGRLVALKTFRIGYSVRDQEMEQFRIRFLREAQSAGILTHPNIVTIHDVVEGGEDGMAFIAMEYVKGTNLKLLLQGEQELGLPFVLDTVAQVGDALDYAHSNRVVHRDVKPANILITADNKVKITDFGIARLDSSNLTQEGQLLGTPNYMAPEQIQGKEVDHRADLFSLGVVLYEMLTRHKPFQGENLTVVSHRIVYDHFTPPQDYVRNLPPGLEPVLAKALEKDPARRYQRARDLVDDLRKVVESGRRRDDLNETQSLSATLVLPPSLPPVPAAPPPAAAKPAKGPSLFGRWRKEAPPAPPPAPGPALPPPLPPLSERAARGGSGDTSASSGSSGAAGSSASMRSGTGTGVGTGTTTGSSAAGLSGSPASPLSSTSVSSITAPPPADAGNATAVTAVPPPPARKAAMPRSSPLRLLLIGGMALLLCVVIGAGALLWLDWTQPSGPGYNAAEDARRVQVLNLMRDGIAHMRGGDFATAAGLFRQAEQLAPDWKGVRKLREGAEAQLSQSNERLTQAQQVAYQVTAAQQALAAKRFDEAIAASSAALQLDPVNQQANDLLTQAKAGQLRVQQQRQAQTARRPPRPGEVIASTPTAVETPAVPGVSEPSPAEARPATLHVHFVSDFADGGVVIVYVDGRERWRDSAPGRSMFRRSAGRHEVNRGFEIPIGTWQIRVHIAPSGRAARVKSLEGSFPGGSSRTLEVQIPASGDGEAFLR